jgi:hypothetical protein
LPREPAIASAISLLCVSGPADSTSRLSGKCRKNEVLVSSARSAIPVTVVAS